MSKIKPSKGAPYARIIGVGGYRPTRVVPNEVILETIDSSDEWIRSRSGIATRHWASDEETVAMMSVEASGKAIADAGIAPEQIGGVIVSTVSHFKQTPAVATDIAHRIGAGKPAAFDISAGCAGFGYGLTLAKGMIVEGSAEYVLVIGVERLSDLTDLSDRATAFLFGDGAGAVVLRRGEQDEPGAVLGVSIGSDGSQEDLITVVDRQSHFSMQGQAVYRQAVVSMADSASRAMADVGWTVDDVDWFVGHQANQRILDAVANRVGIGPDRAISNVAHVGNTAAASIPLALSEAASAGRLRAGDRVVLSAFGGGATWGAATLTWPRID